MSRPPPHEAIRARKTRTNRIPHDPGERAPRACHQESTPIERVAAEHLAEYCEAHSNPGPHQSRRQQRDTPSSPGEPHGKNHIRSTWRQKFVPGYDYSAMYCKLLEFETVWALGLITCR